MLFPRPRKRKRSSNGSDDTIYPSLRAQRCAHQAERDTLIAVMLLTDQNLTATMFVRNEDAAELFKRLRASFVLGKTIGTEEGA